MVQNRKVSLFGAAAMAIAGLTTGVLVSSTATAASPGTVVDPPPAGSTIPDDSTAPAVSTIPDDSTAPVVSTVPDDSATADSSATAAGITGVTVDPAPSDGSMTDQIIVTFATSPAQLSAAEIEAAAGPGAIAVREFAESSQIIRLPEAQSGAALEAVMQSIAQQPGVVNVAPDVIAQPYTNDTDFGKQWDLSAPKAGNYGIDAVGAWPTTKGSAAVKVAILDTGYVNHADLKGRFVGGYDFVSNTMVGNDGNARDNDAHDAGDWVTTSESQAGFFKGCRAKSSSWHGSHVAGTIGAVTDNKLGIAGINSKSPLVPIRVLGKCGGYFTDIVDGMRWAAGLTVSGVPNNPNPSRILSMSLGGPAPCTASSGIMQKAVDEITAKGALVIAAAGNNGRDAANFWPASCKGVLTVAATGKAGNRASYSNYGSVVKIAAPGGDLSVGPTDGILSTVNSGLMAPVASPKGDTYAIFQGTSMATPHVSAVASLMLSVNPTLTPAQLTTLLRQTVTKFPTGSSCINSCGSGIVNAKAAVAAAVKATPPPTTTVKPTTTTVKPTTTTVKPTTTTTAPPPVTTTTAPPPVTTTTVPVTAPPVTTTKPPASTVPLSGVLPETS